MQKNAGITMILGAIIFVAGAFQPAVVGVFDAASEAEALAVLENSSLGWDVGNLLFGLGGLIITLGVGLLARHILTRDISAAIRRLTLTCAALVGAGGLLWATITYDRIIMSPQDTLTGTGFGEPWIFPLYSILSLVGLTLLGVAILRSGYPSWFGWYVTGFHLIQFILGLVTWDATPFYWYAPMALIGIVLVVLSYRSVSRPQFLIKTSEQS